MLKPLFLTALIMLSCSTSRENFSETRWAEEVNTTNARDLYAPHYSDGKFFNPWMPMKEKNIKDLIMWKLISPDDYTDDEKIHIPDIFPDALKRIKALGVRDFILWIGHNTFLLRINGEYWLTDPVFSKRVVILKRITPPGISMKDLNELTEKVNVVISHNHYDHFDADSIRELPAGSKFFTPLGLKGLIHSLGKADVTELDWWQNIDLGSGVKLHCVPVQHWSRRIGQAMNSTLWAGFILTTPSVTVYFGGDSGYFKGYREIGEKFPGIDYAFIPTTAYHPRWFMHYAHIDAAEAVKAFVDLKAKFFIPTQWGTFQLGSEPAGYPGIDLLNQAKAAGVHRSRILLMGIGELVFPDQKKRN